MNTMNYLHYLALLLLSGILLLPPSTRGFNISQLSLDNLLPPFENETTDSSEEVVTTERILSTTISTSTIKTTTKSQTTKATTTITTTEVPKLTSINSSTITQQSSSPASNTSTTESSLTSSSEIPTTSSPSNEPSTAKWKLYSIIIGSSILFLLILIISITVFCVRRKHRQRLQQQSTQKNNGRPRTRTNTLTRGPAVDWIRPQSTISPYPLPNPYRHRETQRDHHLRTSNVDVSQWLFNED